MAKELKQSKKLKLLTFLQDPQKRSPLSSKAKEINHPESIPQIYGLLSYKYLKWVSKEMNSNQKISSTLQKSPSPTP